MKEQLKDIGVALKPVNLIKGAMGGAVNAAKKPSVISTAIGIGIPFLADRLLFRKRGFIFRTVGLFAVRKLVNKFTAKRGL
ncbi:MAG: hypothetical protein H7Y31_18390 [Chitinophagaceae bacterium]|nr:hypothetical protein [Chitinophagaceae bacterium]